MSKLGDRVLTEKTRVRVTIANFALLIFTIVSGVVFAVTWKETIEYAIKDNTQMITQESIDRTLSDKIIQKDVIENNTILIQTETQLTEMELKAEARHAETQTNLKWIMVSMERDK